MQVFSTDRSNTGPAIHSVPPGSQETEPMHWPAVYGGKMSGAGGILSDSLHKANHGSRLCAIDRTKPLLTYQGFGGIIDQLTFSGDRRLRAGQRGTIGLLVDKDPESGMGCGKLHLRDVSFTQFETAVQLGFIEPGQQVSKEHNADQLQCDRLHTHGCLTAVKVTHEQGLDVNIDQLRPYATPVAFDFEGGGNLACRMLLCMYGVKTILQTGPYVGSNSAKYSIGEGGAIVCDTNNGVPVFLRQGKRCASAEFKFSNVRTGNSTQWPEEPIFQLKGGSTLILNGFKSLKPGSIKFVNSIVEKYKNYIELRDVITSVTDLAELFTGCKGECTVLVGAVRNGFGVQSITPGLYLVQANSDGVEAQKLTDTAADTVLLSDTLFAFKDESRAERDNLAGRLAVLEAAKAANLATDQTQSDQIMSLTSSFSEFARAMSEVARLAAPSR